VWLSRQSDLPMFALEHVDTKIPKP
jgi:hypothetical protein